MADREATDDRYTPRFVARFLGRTLSYTYEVIDFVPNERLVMATTEGPFPMETTYGWSDLSGQRTHMTASLTINSLVVSVGAGEASAAEPMMVRIGVARRTPYSRTPRATSRA